MFEKSAGGSVGLNVSLVDANDKRVTEAYSVAFTSNCVTAQQTLLDTNTNTNTITSIQLKERLRALI